jgi:hypothetical protein
VSRAALLSVVALGAVTLAYALPLQPVGCGQTSHYAATRSFAEGRPFIDRYAEETCDLVRRDGHYYAAKAPAMDFWAAPWYLALRGLGAVPPNPQAGEGYPAAMLGLPVRALWQIGLWAVVLPALGLLVLVRRTVERLEPGLGTVVAVALGLGTLVLPFSTLLFAHVPAAALGFLAFALLFGRGATLARTAAAGAAAGLAASTDLPLAVPAVLLGLYAAAGPPRLRRLAAFGAGGAVGLLPLLAFDWWAFGSPFHLAYAGAAINPGANGVELSPNNGFFTLGVPHFRVAMELLLGGRGLLVLTPLVAAGAAGIVLLWRRGLRAEAALVAGLCVAEVAWNAGRPGYELALGGWVPGPRFLIPLLPFLCFALAPALRAAPAVTGALALVSAGSMVVATAAEPLLANDDTRHWFSRVAHGNFAETVLSRAGVGHGWLGIAPFLAAVLLAAGAAVAAAVPLRVTRRDLLVASAALVAWILVEHGAPELLRVDRSVHQGYGLAAAVLLLAAAVWAVLRVRAAGLRPALPAVPLLAFATVRFDEHTKWGLAVGVLVLVGLALTGPLGGRLRRAGVPSPLP